MFRPLVFVSLRPVPLSGPLVCVFGLLTFVVEVNLWNCQACLFLSDPSREGLGYGFLTDLLLLEPPDGSGLSGLAIQSI